MTLCAGQKRQYYESQLSQYIYRAKKLLWYKQQEISNNHKREAIGNYQVLDPSNTRNISNRRR
jgi:STIP1 family protein 1